MLFACIEKGYAYNTFMHRFKNESGFSLVELIVATAFLAGMTIAIVTLFIGVEANTRNARILALATAELENRIEGYRDAGYSALPTPSENFTSSLPTQLGSARSGTTAVTDDGPGLRRVVVTITYAAGKQQKTITATTLMAQQGLNR